MKINELLNLLKRCPFDRESAEKMIKSISNINQLFPDDYGFMTTYLQEAQRCNNPEAVQFLLENGADPNVYDKEKGESCPLWELQYRGENDKEDQSRYEIAKLLLEYGADPNIEDEGESLFNYVTYKVYNEIGVRNWKYICRFYKLLIAYGGGRYDFARLIDKAQIDEYKLEFELAEDGYHIRGFLSAPDGSACWEL